MDFQWSYFKSWKMMLWKCRTQYASTFGKLAVATRLEKFSFHSIPKERQCQRMLKLLHNCTHYTLAKWCSKFSKPGFNSTWTMNFPMFKLDLEKAEEPEIKLSTSTGSWKKQESSKTNKQTNKQTKPHLFLLYWLCQSLWLCGSPQTLENSERDGNTKPPDLPLEKPICRSGNNS